MLQESKINCSGFLHFLTRCECRGSWTLHWNGTWEQLILITLWFPLCGRESDRLYYSRKKSLVHLIMVTITWRRENFWCITYHISLTPKTRAMHQSCGHIITLHAIIYHHLKSESMVCAWKWWTDSKHQPGFAVFDYSVLWKFLPHQFSLKK